MKNLIVILFIVIGLANTMVAQQDSTAVDSLLLKQLEQQMQAAAPPAPTSQAAPRSAPTTNPDLSAIGDFRALYTSEGKRNVELYFNQLEMQLTSVVDPYARANFLFSFGKDSVNGNFSTDLEEATLTTLDLPYQLQATVGKFKPHFTKVNTLHPHAFSFVDFPTMLTRYFSDEGLFMEGISASWLVPNPSDFYQELDVEIGRMQASAEKEGAAEETRIQRAAEEDMRKVVLAAEQEIATAAKLARRELSTHTANLAVALARQQINVDSNTDQVLVRTFASKLTSSNDGGKDGR